MGSPSVYLSKLRDAIAREFKLVVNSERLRLIPEPKETISYRPNTSKQTYKMYRKHYDCRDTKNGNE